MPLPSAAVICKTSGLFFAETLRTLTGVAGEDRIDKYSRRFIEKSAKIRLERTVLLDGVKPSIAILNNRQLDLGIVSTKFRYRTEAFPRRENIREAFKNHHR